MIDARSGLLEETFNLLLACGGGREECVAYWTGPIGPAFIVDVVVQPVHRAGRTWYEVDDGWVTGYFLELRETGRTIRAQIHTHPGRSVSHSQIDDAFAIAPNPGFASIVIPGFATGRAQLEGSSVAICRERGGWEELDASRVISWF